VFNGGRVKYFLFADVSIKCDDEELKIEEDSKEEEEEEEEDE
jgi:hypothetical protein